MAAAIALLFALLYAVSDGAIVAAIAELELDTDDKESVSVVIEVLAVEIKPTAVSIAVCTSADELLMAVAFKFAMSDSKLVELVAKATDDPPRSARVEFMALISRLMLALDVRKAVEVALAAFRELLIAESDKLTVFELLTKVSSELIVLPRALLRFSEE